jgi:hypothetical protein
VVRARKTLAWVGRVVVVEDSAKLPPGTWAPRGSVDVNQGDGPRIGANSDDILAGIERDGYYEWPAKKDA